jgi:hypothetical protein
MFQIWQLNGVNIIHKDDNEKRIQYKGYSTLIPFSNSILCGNSSISFKKTNVETLNIVHL